MNVSPSVNFEELARCTDDFNGAQLKVCPWLVSLDSRRLIVTLSDQLVQAVCVEAGMLALRRGGTELQHEDYVEGVSVVQSKKKTSLNYYA